MRLPSLRKHKTGQGFFTLHGHDYYCGVWGKPETQCKYERLLSEYLANKHSFTAAKSETSKTVEDLAVSYLDYAKETYDAGEYNNIRLIAGVMLDLYGKLPANDFGGVQFKTVRAKFASEKIKKERSRQYVNKCMRLVIRMFGWCTGEELVEARVVGVLREIDPLKLGRTDAPESEPVVEVDQSAVDATLPHLPPIVADMVVLQQLLGCRPGELCGLRPCLVDRSQPVWRITLAKHKTAHKGKKRTIYVGPRAQSILLKYLDRDTDEYCFKPGEAMEQRHAIAESNRTANRNQGNRRGYGVASRNGSTGKSVYSERYKTSSYGHAIAYACKQAWPAPTSISKSEALAWHREHKWSPNQLRHSAAGEIREQFGIEHVAAVLGHSDISTSQLYAKLRAEQAIEAASTR